MSKRNQNGQFKKGESGNPAGRPLGSKNKVTIMQTALQEGWLEGNRDKIEEVLNSVVEDALQGDNAARKMIWEANIAKPSLKEEAGDKEQAPQILIKHMEVKKQGDIVDVEPIGDDDE
jgi:hypothetical protein